MKLYYPSQVILHEKESRIQVILWFFFFWTDLVVQSSSCVIELCSGFSEFFFFFCLIVPYDLGRKKKKPTWKCVQSGKCLRAFSVQGVWSKVWMSKLSGWRYRLCSVLCWRWTFFQAIEELKNFCQGLDRPLGGLDGSTGCPPGSSGAGQKARVSNWGPGGGRGPWAAWTAGCWPCLEEAGALRMPICPFLAPVGREKEALIWIA